jgi:hypothetical protein
MTPVKRIPSDATILASRDLVVNMTPDRWASNGGMTPTGHILNDAMNLPSKHLVANMNHGRWASNGGTTLGRGIPNQCHDLCQKPGSLAAYAILRLVGFKQQVGPLMGGTQEATQPLSVGTSAKVTRSSTTKLRTLRKVPNRRALGHSTTSVRWDLKGDVILDRWAARV